MAGPIDFDSEFGFKQTAKKKKANAKAKANDWGDDDEKKDDAAGGDEGNKDSAGDTGFGAGGTFTPMRISVASPRSIGFV